VVIGRRPLNQTARFRFQCSLFWDLWWRKRQWDWFHPD